MKKTGYGPLLLVILLMPWVATAAPSSTQTSTQESFSFGVVPQQNPTALAKTWAPVLSYLSQKTGYKLEFQTAKDIATFNQRLKAGAFDIAYMNPFLYAVDKSRHYKVFAKEKDTRLRGIIIVAKNSPYSSLASLKNTTMAFPDPDAFAATLLPLAYLEQSGIRVTLKNVMSHDSVYRAVAKGLYPAGGGVVKTLEKTDPLVRDQLRVLWTSPPYTPHPIATHIRTPQPVIDKLFTAMATMHLDPQGKTLLEGLKFKGIESAEDHEYDAIRALSNLSAHQQ